MSASDPLLRELGTVVAHGMDRIDHITRMTGAGCVTVYSTQFQMPDNRWWKLAVEPWEGPNEQA